MDASFRLLTGRERGEPQTLNHKGRSITVPQAALGVARLTFADLCAAPSARSTINASRTVITR
jgi:cell division protein ZapE